MFRLAHDRSIWEVTFSGWACLEYDGVYIDTFIFPIDALNGQPPFGYRPLLQRLVAELNKKTRRFPLDLRFGQVGVKPICQDYPFIRMLWLGEGVRRVRGLVLA